MGKLPFRQIHLDFHNSEKFVSIGEKFDAEEFADTLEKASVNSITCFSKCHHGMIYHNTKFTGAKHPGLKIDLLKEQIDACHRRGIKVPVYISAGCDQYIAVRHPEWVEITPKGRIGGPAPFEPGFFKLCLNSDYIDYLEEETEEIFNMFDVDGFFFDIVSQFECCCRKCVDDMERLGIDAENSSERKRFALLVIRNFKNRLTARIRKHDAECSLFFNSGHITPDLREVSDTFSHIELEALPSSGLGYEYFPVNSRYAKTFGTEIVGMTSRFSFAWGDFGGYKNEEALEYECMTSLSLGGKCSVGDQLHPSGEMDSAAYELIGKIYRKVKQKEAWCDDVESVAEIGVFNTDAIGKKVGYVDPSMSGAYRMLEEAHYLFDVVDGYCDFSPYQLIIFPDKINMDEKLKEKTEKYIQNGGSVLLTHKSGMNSEETAFVLQGTGLDYIGESEFSPDYVKVHPEIGTGIADAAYVMYERGLAVKPSDGAEILADIWNPYFNRTYKHFTSHIHAPVEKKSGHPAVVRNGRVIYLAYPIFHMYKKFGIRFYRQMTVNCIRLLTGEKIIHTNAPSTAHFTLNRQKFPDRHILHILNYIPEKRYGDIDFVDCIIPIYDIDVKVAIDKRPAKVYCAPEMRELDFEYSDGYVHTRIPAVNGHEMVVFE